jgi:4'-phosphopantetheinyl transferase
MIATWDSPPGRIEALASEVHVWRIDLDPGAARLALPRILASYLGENPTGIELRTGVHGKPALRERPPRLRFNLSHSDRLALVAISGEREVGVDVEVEEVSRDFIRLAEVGLDEERAATIRDATPSRRAAAFYAAWVRHEATVKCLGTGLGAPPPERPVSVLDLEVGAGHAAAVAVAGSAALPLRRFAFPVD